MLLLIDGYNLLHQSDLLERGRGDAWLDRARKRLLRKLYDRLDPELAKQTCIVFDAGSTFSNQSRDDNPGVIEVLFATEHPEADDLIEDLITRHSHPRRLTLVSSDHRLQRAARQRRAHWFDSDSWYQQLIDRGPQLGIPWPPDSNRSDKESLEETQKPNGVTEADDVKHWMRLFGDSDPGPDSDTDPDPTHDANDNPSEEWFREKLLGDHPPDPKGKRPDR